MKLIMGYCTYVEDNPDTWCAQKQKVVSWSSVEVEYCAIVATARNTMWVQLFLLDLSIMTWMGMPTHCDNKMNLFIVENLVFQWLPLHLWQGVKGVIRIHQVPWTNNMTMCGSPTITPSIRMTYLPWIAPMMFATMDIPLRNDSATSDQSSFGTILGTSSITHVGEFSCHSWVFLI